MYQSYRYLRMKKEDSTQIIDEGIKWINLLLIEINGEHFQLSSNWIYMLYILD